MIGRGKTFLFVVLVVVIVFAAAAYWMFLINDSPSQAGVEITDKISTSTPPQSATSTSEVSDVSESNTKTYRNEEWGFKFEYPKGWAFDVNSFYSPFSKFNLVGAPKEKTPNPLSPLLLLNIVTTDFINNAVKNFQKLDATESTLFIDGVSAKRYAYTSDFAKITVVFPLEDYHIIIAAKEEHEDIFDQILASFKFIGSSKSSQ